MGTSIFARTDSEVIPVSPSPSIARVGLLAVVAAGVLASLVLTSPAMTAHAVAVDGESLTRLLRAMAVIKGGLALGAVAVVFWRLGTAVTLSWFGGYAAGVGAIAAGPGLIWGMAHIGLGAILLHGGLLTTVLLLWRDPAVAMRLEALIGKRRAALNRR